MRFLLSAVGSLGDVEPFVVLAAGLRRAGHDARVYANAAYAWRAEEDGVPFVATGSDARLRALREQAAAADPRRKLQVLAEAVMDSVPAAIAALRADVDPGRTVLVASSFSFATRLVAKADGVPLAVAHFAPAMLRSEFVAPRLTPLGHLASMPRFVKRAMWSVMDRRLLDPAFAVPLSRIAATLGLPPISNVFGPWMHEASLTLGLFPRWFAAPQPDWPAALQLTGFPFGSPAGGPLPPALQSFVAAGPAPVVVTAGTASAGASAFFSAAVDACGSLGRRAVLVGTDPSSIPAGLPDSVMHVEHVPFAALFAHAAAVVHHGGVGTMAEAMRAGVPQVIRPGGFDQWDNASRARSLGVAREWSARRPAAADLAHHLRALLDDAATRDACARLKSRLASEDGSGLAVAALERCR